MRETDAYKTLMQELLEQVQAEPETIIDFVHMVFEQCPPGWSTTYLDSTLSFLPMEDWPLLVHDAIAILRSGEDTNTTPYKRNHEAARSVLEYANLQAPDSLDPYKTELADMADLYLVEFDDPPELYPAHAWHIAFTKEYLKELLETRSQWIEKRIHPTWIEAPAGAALLPFGDMSKATCGICAGRLHHILTLDPIPDWLGVTGIPRLELSVCLECFSLGAGVLSYQHDEQGRPHDISQSERWPQFADINTRTLFQFKPTQVALVDLGSRWQRQDRGGSNGRENLNRVGGHPSWVQFAEYPPCPICGQNSRFLLQLDDDLLTYFEETGETSNWLWSVGGMAYIFWCDTCKVSTIGEQCT